MRLMDAFQTFLVTLGAMTPPAGPPGERVRLEGFDPGRIADPDERDPQYRFARVIADIPLVQLRTLGDAERLLACLRPRFLRAGLSVRRIDGDRLLFDFGGRLQWVDVLRGVGGQAPAWQWAPRAERIAA